VSFSYIIKESQHGISLGIDGSPSLWEFWGRDHSRFYRVSFFSLLVGNRESKGLLLLGPPI
jgi:hypothetical protein